MTLTLRTRLTIVYVAIFGALLTGLSVASYRLLARQLDADATARLVELTDGLHGYLRFDHGSPSFAVDPGDPDQGAFVQEATRYYQIFNADTGALLVQSAALGPLGLRFTPAEVRAFRDQQRLQDINTDYGTIRMSNGLVSSAGQMYLLQVGVSLNSVNGALDLFLEMLLWSVPIGLLAATLAGRWLAGYGLAPLASFAQATRHIDVKNLQQRLPVRGTGDELDEVAKAFNETLTRLEHAVREMRQFSTALAHELRTPLAALRGEIEMSILRRQQGSTLRRGGAEIAKEDGKEEDERRLVSQLEEIDKLTRLIAQLLTLARAEAGDIPLSRSRVDLTGLVASLVDQLEPIANAKAVELRFDPSGQVAVDGDAEWLGRLVLNLVDNAIKFTPNLGQVFVGVSRKDEGAILEVRDTGKGIAPDVLPHIFEPFFRADLARSPGVEGAGLGLSLVKWIVDRHRGRIEVQSQPGKGSTFTVWLPVH